MREQIEVLVTEEQLFGRIAELSAEIGNDYQRKNPVLVSVLKGSFMFVAHLMRQLTCNPEIDFIEASSYGADKVSSGTIRIHKDLSREIRGRHIIIVEDVLDTGLTLNYLVQSLSVREPKSIEVCALVVKDVKRKGSIIKPKYVGFTLPDVFIVGFGLDHNERYRELPYIGYIPDSPA